MMFALPDPTVDVSIHVVVPTDTLVLTGALPTPTVEAQQNVTVSVGVARIRAYKLVFVDDKVAMRVGGDRYVRV